MSVWVCVHLLRVSHLPEHAVHVSLFSTTHPATRFRMLYGQMLQTRQFHKQTTTRPSNRGMWQMNMQVRSLTGTSTGSLQSRVFCSIAEPMHPFVLACAPQCPDPFVPSRPCKALAQTCVSLALRGLVKRTSRTSSLQSNTRFHRKIRRLSQALLYIEGSQSQCHAASTARHLAVHFPVTVPARRANLLQEVVLHAQAWAKTDAITIPLLKGRHFLAPDWRKCICVWHTYADSHCDSFRQACSWQAGSAHAREKLRKCRRAFPMSYYVKMIDVQ